MSTEELLRVGTVSEIWHLRNACLLLATAHTHEMLVLHSPRLTPVQILFPEAFCWFYQLPNVSVNSISRVHRWSSWYITQAWTRPKKNASLLYSSSSSSLSSCRAASTDIRDSFSPILPIINRLWQVFKATTRILTGHNTNHIRNEPVNYFSIAGLIYNKTLNLFQLYCSPVGCECRIRRVHHCQTVRTPLISVLDMKLKCTWLESLQLWRFG